MPLTEQQKKRLRGLGHNLKPVITVGTGGLSDSLLEEFESSLEHHELMKVKINTGDRDERDTTILKLCEYSGAQLIQRVGNMGLLFRKKSTTAVPLSCIENQEGPVQKADYGVNGLQDMKFQLYE